MQTESQCCSNKIKQNCITNRTCPHRRVIKSQNKTGGRLRTIQQKAKTHIKTVTQTVDDTRHGNGRNTFPNNLTTQNGDLSKTSKSLKHPDGRNANTTLLPYQTQRIGRKIPKREPTGKNPLVVSTHYPCTETSKDSPVACTFIPI